MSTACLWLAICFAATPVEMPKVADDRLVFELFADAPQIVTPTGIAVDDQGGVLVVECHTHFPPAGYQGLPTDRIRRFMDTDGDGLADKITTFYEGTKHTMNLAIARDGSVYVATRNEVFRLRDKDGDSVAEERTPIVRMETAGDYPHNGLSGFAFDMADNVYFGMGENLGVDFKLIGSDGATIADNCGGHIFRCGPNGEKLQRWATGFWNPFHVAFDSFGRLFAVDNDPDSMPPCRLLHIVRGGNYGYRFSNGRKGLHPFTAWNGELPGTLPMVAGTGEAPSGVVAYDSDNLPAEYRGELLVTSWGDHRIDRFHLEPHGASFKSVGKPLISGGENFRPVGIALAPDGSLYISDWVDKSYEVHGKGRLWHLRAAQKKTPERPSDLNDAAYSLHRPLREKSALQFVSGHAPVMHIGIIDGHPEIVATRYLAVFRRIDQLDERGFLTNAILQRVRGNSDLFAPDSPRLPLWCLKNPDPAIRAGGMAHLLNSDNEPRLWQASEDADPFMAQSARVGLTRLGVVKPDMDRSKLTPAQRLACLLILRESGDVAAQAAIPSFLGDSDPAVRFAALQWVGEEKLSQYRDQLSQVLTAGPTSAQLFSGYLAALDKLDGAKRDAGNEWAGEQYVAQAVVDEKSPIAVRRWALRVLRPDHAELSPERLRKFLTSGDADLSLEAVRTLRESRHSECGPMLCDIAGRTDAPLTLRAEAVVGLSNDDPTQRALLWKLATGDQLTLRDEALRSLRGAQLSAEEVARLGSIKSQPGAPELVERVIDPAAKPARPKADDLDAWDQLLSSGDRPGDAAAGERIFFHAKSAGCSKCHQMTGRGGRVGPELSTTARTLERRRLLQSILRPSAEVAPQFTEWLILTTDGRALSGILLGDNGLGEQTYGNAKGEVFKLKTDQIESRQAQKTSIMPEGLADTLTLDEFRDLLAYLGGGK